MPDLPERSEKEKMLRGELYNPTGPALVRERLHARALLSDLNAPGDRDAGKQHAIATQLFGAVGAAVWIEKPFFCDYGYNITLGEKVFINFNCVFLDTVSITIGDRVLFAPGVQLYTATHPLDYRLRQQELESGSPITIGDDVWLGGNTIVLPGVSIGARSAIGAGSVVAKNIPADVLAVGNPCRVIRELT